MTKQNKLKENLNFILKKKEINIAKLSNDLDVPRSTLSNVLTGRSGVSKSLLLIKLSDYLNISIDSLMKDDLVQKYSESKLFKNLIPVYDWHTAHQYLLENKPFDYDLEKSIKNHSKLNVNDLFALNSKRTFEPRFLSDSILIFEKTNQYIDNSYVLVYVDESPESFLMKYTNDGQEQYLTSISNQGKTTVTSKTQFLGVLLQQRFSAYDRYYKN